MNAPEHLSVQAGLQIFDRPVIRVAFQVCRYQCDESAVDRRVDHVVGIDDGLITLVTTNLEGHSSYRTIEDLQANLDRDMFWRVHRSFLVNINRIKEVVPWFKSSYQLRMDDRKHTEVPVSRVQTRRLRELFKL